MNLTSPLPYKTKFSYKLDIEVVDILRDKSKLEFKRESKAKIVRRNGLLIIEQFYPMNLLQKLSLMEESVDRLARTGRICEG